MDIHTYRAKMVERNRANATHGMTKSPEYVAWHDMKNRCYLKSNKQYKDYGGRGIKVCAEWRDSFEQFFADMGCRPDGHSIDRIDNSRGYDKYNCRWATRRQQDVNRSNSRVLDFNGKQQTVVEWAEELKNPQLRNRLHRGWSVHRALTTPYKERPNAKT